MGKKLLFMLAFVVLGIGSICAQVLVGGAENGTIHDGAIMELKSGDNKGLLMPQVALTDAKVWAPVAGSQMDGMLVYNTNPAIQNGLVGKGIYVWTNGAWLPASSTVPCTSAPPTPILGVSGLANGQVRQFEPFAVYVDNPTPGAWYEWTLPTGLIGQSNTNVITIVGTNVGQYTISVTAHNECGSSIAAITSVTVFSLPTYEDNSGNVTIQGVTCFDVAQSERGDACGSLANRTPAFPDAAKRTRTYTISIQEKLGLSNLRVGWMDDTDNIIQSVTIAGNVSGSLALNAYTVTVVFADDINNIVKNKLDYTATIKLYAMYQDGSVDKYVTLPITVKDCACCPLDVAKIAENVVAYEGADFIPVTGDPLSNFNPIPNSALCIWKENQGRAVSGYVGNSWGEAHTMCTVTMVADGHGSDWRLPNVAEMVNGLHDVFYTDEVNAGNMKTSVYNQISRFISNTAQANARQSIYLTRKSLTTGTVGIDGTTVERNTSRTANYRCVKTISY